MTRINSIARIAAVALLAIAIAVPTFAARGKADFTTFVAIGDSYGAGYVSGSLNEHHQYFSWPAVIARQAGLRFCQPTDTATSDCWAIPLITYPGLPYRFSSFTAVPGPAPALGADQGAAL